MDSPVRRLAAVVGRALGRRVEIAPARRLRLEERVRLRVRLGPPDPTLAIIGAASQLVEAGMDHDEAIDTVLPTVRDLAQRFKTRRQTIYRDLHVLEEVGYPVVGDENGRIAGRPRLAATAGGLARPGLPLTRQELVALVWAAKHTEARQPFRGHLRTAVEKLEALAPSADGRLSVALDGVVGGWDRGSKDYSGMEPIILRLVEAIITRRRCRIVDYRSPQRRRPATRRHDPHHLLLINGGLYSLGKEPERGVETTLAVDRITKVELTAETFALDPAINVERRQSEAFGVIWEKPEMVGREVQGRPGALRAGA